MANDPNQGGWPPPGQQPISYDPQTGQPVYAQPGQQPTGFDPMTGQPIYGQPPPQYQQQQPPPQQYPQQAPYQQQYQPQQNPYGQQQPPNPYGQQQQMPYAQAPQMQYAQAPQMQYATAQPSPYDQPGGPTPSLRQQADATVGVSDRVRFIRLTYLHLFGAMAAFAGMLAALFKVPFLGQHVTLPLVKFAIGDEYVAPRWHWAVVMGAFMGASWIADTWARNSTSRGVQYLGLAFYCLAEALIFVPLLAIVMWFTEAKIAAGGGDPNILRDSAITTLAIFGALTLSVFISKKDFSFMRSGLMMMSGAALTLIVLSLVFGFNLGAVFAVAMVVLAGGYILYQTSQVLAHYDTQQYVAAALALFSSVALMFWYIIQLFMRARR